MAGFAKLSGALLARKEAPLGLVPKPTAAPPPPKPANAPAPGNQDKLLAAHLRALNLPPFLCEYYDRLARQSVEGGLEHSRHLLRLAEQELIERKRRLISRRIKAAHFPGEKTLDAFDFSAVPSLNKSLVLGLAQGDFIQRRENVIAVGDIGIGKTHLAVGLGMAACEKGYTVRYFTAATLARELFEAREKRRLRSLQRRLAGYKVLIIDELGYTPLPATAAELMFEVIGERYERSSTIITSNLPVDEWVPVFGSAQLACALLDRLTHHVHILNMTGPSYRRQHGGVQSPELQESAARRTYHLRPVE